MLTEEDAPKIDFPKDAGDGLTDAVDFPFRHFGEGDVKRFVDASLQFSGRGEAGINFNEGMRGVASRKAPSLFASQFAKYDPRGFNFAAGHK
jgi:hypothetical protein